jgi:hypothetical protein
MLHSASFISRARNAKPRCNVVVLVPVCYCRSIDLDGRSKIALER